MIPKTILITGASGLIGTRLTEMLLSEGFRVRHLTRSKKSNGVPSFVWDVRQELLEEGAFDSVDVIIHLAGAGIADKRWTDDRKKEILESRTKSTALLVEKLRTTKHTVQAFIASSAIGYYGFEGDKVFSENDEPGTDFLAGVVKQWEALVDKIKTLNIRTVKIRTGIVLSKEGGALKEIAKPVQFGFGAPLGTGQQHMSWVHIDDLCRMFLFAITNKQMTGPYNGVSPTWTTNETLTKVVAKILKRPLWLPNVPGFALKLVLGEMADLVLQGSKISSAKIEDAGFDYRFPVLVNAVQDLYSTRNSVS